jgi:hypothetical protein
MKNPFTILNGIIATIVLSVVGLIVLIVFSGTLDFGLVEQDYYEKGLQYQDQIDRIESTNKLSEPVMITNLGNHVLIKYPEIFDFNTIEGKTQLFRPSDPKLDRILPLQLDEEGQQIINVSSLNQGAWIVKLNWSQDSVEYYTEKRIFLNK